MTYTLNPISDNVKGCIYGKTDESVSSYRLMSDRVNALHIQSPSLMQVETLWSLTREKGDRGWGIDSDGPGSWVRLEKSTLKIH